MGVWKEGCSLLLSHHSFLQNTTFLYSWFLDGCDSAKFCMFMKWDYSTWAGVHCTGLYLSLSISVWIKSICHSGFNTIIIRYIFIFRLP